MHDYVRCLFMTGLFLSSENRLILHIRATNEALIKFKFYAPPTLCGG